MTKPDPRRLVAENYKLIYHYAWKLAPWAAEDVAQEACVLAIHRDNYRPGLPVPNWLYWCVMSARARHIRSDTKHKKSNAAMRSAEPVRALPAVQEHATELALLADKIETLPPRQREVMTGIMAGNHTGEISRQLGVTCQAVGSMARKARVKLAA